MYYIYEIKNKNKINRKTYIGQRKCPKGKIIELDKYMGSGMYLYRAKKKYGLENFEKKIIAICGTFQNADILEKVFIALYRSEGKAEYNIASGGDGGNTLRYASFDEKIKHKEKLRKIMNKPEIKALVSQKTKEALRNPDTYNKLKESHLIAMNKPEVKEKMRKSHLGKKLPEEVKQKLRESSYGKNTWSKGRTYYTNGKTNVCTFVCPEGFHKGRTWRKDMNKKSYNNFSEDKNGRF